MSAPTQDSSNQSNLENLLGILKSGKATNTFTFRAWLKEGNNLSFEDFQRIPDDKILWSGAFILWIRNNNTLAKSKFLEATRQVSEVRDPSLIWLNNNHF